MTSARALNSAPGHRSWWAFRLWAVALVTLVTESASWIALAALEGAVWPLPGVLRRQDLLRFDETITREQVEAHSFFGASAIHPYLGYVQVPEPGLVNEWGLLGPASPIQQRRADRVIVGVFGGSVAAQFASWPEPFIRSLGRHREFQNKEIVIVNAALGGHKQPQSLMALSYLLSVGAEFDLVITIDGFNEVALAPFENIPRGVASSYPRSWDLMVRKQSDSRVRAQVEEIEEWKRRRQRWARRFSKLSFRYSFSANLLWRSADRWLENEVARSALRLHSSATRSHQYSELGPRDTSGASLFGELAAIWSRSSRAMRGLAQSHGARYVHVLQPNQYFNAGRAMSAGEASVAMYAGSPYRPSVEKGYPLLRAEGERLRRDGVEFVDLCEVFNDVGEPVYVDSCCHYTTRGKTILAERIAQFIGRRENDAALSRAGKLSQPR